ncbi:MAG TPA: hypothetical protein VLE73_00155 [Candidatus Saccharimonadales bacterium]|nr:hypothetical protein [Candidatus Saccharimonadales bacterium]
MASRKQTKKLRPGPGAWFVPLRGSYIPASAAGWWTYLPFTAYLVFALVAGLQGTESIAMATLFIVPNWIAAAAVMTYIAARKS